MINELITTLVEYGINNDLIKEEDRIYTINRILNLLKLDEYVESKPLKLTFEQLLDKIIEYAVENKIIEDTQNEKDLFDTELMNLFVDRPSNVINKFFEEYSKSPSDATNYFYKLSVKSNYVRWDRIKKDLRWVTPTKYGDIDISINLSKPEKDPKDIARALKMKSTSYPKCLLCLENEGYRGRVNHPARANIRLIPIKLNNRDFYLQYSPYSYYNEHCIVLDKEHIPMRINEETFRELLDFVSMFPHYMIGSNADIPIVGGSILTHSHYQGGLAEFPIFRARSIYERYIGNSKIMALNWPLSSIKVESESKEELINIAIRILSKWIRYENKELNIISYTGDTRHNTITPVFRMEKNKYVAYLILRNNLTSDKYPMGIYHPHPEYHNIKKENIGIIEAIGLAILPSRLKKQMELMEDALTEGKDYHEIEELKIHSSWLDKLEHKETITKENVHKILEDYIGITFMKILENCGVFKLNEEGINEFIKFVNDIDGV